MTTKICKRCGKEFTTNHNARKFCSEQCSQSYYIFGAKQTEFKCEWCGKTFTFNRRKKYCSKECRAHAYSRHKRTKKADTKPKNFMSIEEVAKASREMGMSAGEYMAKFCYEKEGV